MLLSISGASERHLDVMGNIWGELCWLDRQGWVYVGGWGIKEGRGADEED